MEILYKQRLQQHRKQIVEHLRPEDVVQRLIIMHFITRDQRDRLQRELHRKGSYAHNEMLLDILLGKDPKSNPLENFLVALENTNQVKLAGLIKHNISADAALSAQDCRVIQSHYYDLVTEMKTSEVIKYLKQDKGFFSSNELPDILAKPTDNKKADYLLSEVIMKGTYRHLAGLSKALIDVGQESLTHKLPRSAIPSQTKLSSSAATKEVVTVLCKIECDSQTLDLRNKLISKMMDPSQDLHRKLMLQYQFKTLVAEASTITIDTFDLVLTPKHVSKVSGITESLKNGHLKKLIMQYAHLPGKWDLKLQQKELQGAESEVRSFHKQHSEDDFDIGLKDGISREITEKPNGSQIQCDAIKTSPKRSRKKNVPKNITESQEGSYCKAKLEKEQQPTSKEPFKKQVSNVEELQKAGGTEGGLTLQEAIYKVFETIGEKDNTPFDLYHLLVRCKKSKISVTELKTVHGLNMLHMSIDKGRLSFLPVFVHVGWWKVLSKEKIPENSQHELHGNTAKQVAEIKRAKKPLAEFNLANEWESSLSSLMMACRSGDMAKARQLIEMSGEDIFYRDFNGGNALYWAVVYGNVTLVEQLLGAGVDPTARTKKNENLLHVACSVGNVEVIPLLLKTSLNIDPWLLDQSHKAPLDRVAENGDLDMLKKFVANVVMPKDNSVVLSAHMGRLPYLKYLLDDLKMSINATDIYSRTALHRACEGSRMQIMKFLLDRSAEVLKPTCTKRNLLHIAAENGKMDIVEHVISLYKERGVIDEMMNAQDRYNGVELCFLIRGRDKGRDAWHYVEVKRYLVPIFLHKTKSGNVDVATFGNVISSGWGVNPDQDVIDEIEEVFKGRRLNQNADLDMTPLHIAIFKGHKAVAKHLIQIGSKVDVLDSFGNTPLMLAASKGYLDIMSCLEEKGAKFSDINLDGKTVSEIADLNQHEEIVNYATGRSFHKATKDFRQGPLEKFEEKLSRRNLDAVRQSGSDVKREIIDILRDFRIDINTFLMTLGSGPVLEATDDDSPPSIKSASLPRDQDSGYDTLNSETYNNFSSHV